MRRLMGPLLVGMAAALLLGAAPASAQRAFDPQAYHGRHVGAPTQILVLATTHLSGTPDTFDPKVLEPLLARLEAFKPDAIEALPGRSIDQMWRYRESYPDVAQSYGSRATVLAAMARVRIGLDMPEADAEVRRTLKTWPAAPTPAQQRRLATLFCAAGDPASALVQWWRLAPAERIEDELVSAQLVDALAAYDTPARRNENYLIASRLAVRLNQERVYPTDDQADDVGPAYPGDFETDLEAFMSEAWFEKLLQDPNFAPLRLSASRLDTPEKALAVYRMLNSERIGHVDPDGQWLSMIDRASPNNVGRARVATWEARNLRMAANIREVSAQKPGGRVLVIVGSAHKPWLDAYFAQMSDVQVVNAGRVLE